MSCIAAHFGHTPEPRIQWPLLTWRLGVDARDGCSDNPEHRIIVSRSNQDRTPQRPRWLAGVAIVAVAAVVMGLPTLGGGFVGGDDHRLVLNHVFVNHPSLLHAAKLFTIAHRDLYQPLPLLSFQIEFAVAKTLGLFDKGVEGATWLFHLTNIILHAVNAVLVWLVVRTLAEHAGGRGLSQPSEARRGAGDREERPAATTVATVAALLFSVHPLQTEVVAWTNGRMMLMSTLFALLSLLSFNSWLKRPQSKWAVLTALFVLQSAISKVRIALPVLLAIVFLARRARFRWSALALWSVCTLITGVFVWVNVQTTAGASLFAEAAEHLQGPRSVRVLQALGNYFQHFVWPVGLASYYPTPPVVYWSDAGTRQALFVVVPTLCVIGWACRRSRVVLLGMLWFFATLASTLPIFPARNVLAADRYMYLPIIGLVWVVAALGSAAYYRWLAARSVTAGRIVVGALAVIIVPAGIGMSWHVSQFYETPFRKTERIAQLFPETPRVWERVGWSYHRLGRYDKAIECAQKELGFDSPNVVSGGYQLLGMSELRREGGDAGLALKHLAKAMEIDPESPLARYRLGVAHEELGRYAEAATFFEAAIESAPGQNPTINRLAALYRILNRPTDARAMFQKALRNNPYDVVASMGLVELDIEQRTHESYLAARQRLLKLLETMPEDSPALTNLGVVYAALGGTSEAVEAYNEALERDPNNITAALNLAQIYRGKGMVGRARSLFERAMSVGLESVRQAIDVHDFFISQGAFDTARSLWTGIVTRFPESVEAQAFFAWATALAGDGRLAEAQVAALTNEEHSFPLVTVTRAYLALAGARYNEAVNLTDTLCDLGEAGADVRRRFLGALEGFDRRRPNVPWTFCLAARLLIAADNVDAARMSVTFCKERCNDEPCREEVRRLESRLPDATAPTTGRVSPVP